MSKGYTTYTYYSPLTDDNMIRVSMFNAEGHEFFATMPETFGKAYREKLAETVGAIEQAIYAGDDPGEVEIK